MKKKKLPVNACSVICNKHWRVDCKNGFSHCRSR